MTSYQRRKRDIAYYKQCVEELEKICSILVQMVPDLKLPLSMGLAGDTVITPYNNGEFFNKLLWEKGSEKEGKDMGEGKKQEEDVKTAGREKYWDELTEKEQIERMRKILKGQLQVSADLERQVYDLMSHAHDEHARLVAPIDKGFGGGVIPHLPDRIPTGDASGGVYF